MHRVVLNVPHQTNENPSDRNLVDGADRRPQHNEEHGLLFLKRAGRLEHIIIGEDMSGIDTDFRQWNGNFSKHRWWETILKFLHYTVFPNGQQLDQI